MIDLRSDTITTPTPEMRSAMAAAEVGDDVFGDDPTVHKLEGRTAEILGKEAAVYMPSGTMTNQIAVRTHTSHGDEVLTEAESHIYYYEAGAPAAISGVMFRLIRGERGIFSGEDVKAALRPPNMHFPPTTLICVENTHNRGGGSVWPIEKIAEVAAVARENALNLHLDGARLWNASVAGGIGETEYARHFDSVSVCFSKGLGAPVGSVLTGDSEFIDRARRFRKMFGGGMRQAGIIAAGALYALENNRRRLAEDHANAKLLAEALGQIPGIKIDVSDVETNLVYFDVPGSGVDVAGRAGRAGVLVFALGPNTIRAVTSMMVTRDDVIKAAEIIGQTVAQT
jgi:threonine aldolase